MLLKLLTRYLRPYAKQLSLVIFLQLIATLASLYLPGLNADIIDQGVTQGDTHFILTTGGIMLAVAAAQVLATVVAVYFAARAAMSYGRDLRASLFHHIGTFSAREVGQFGAPSLITRTTNDIQQVQMLVLMGSTMLIQAPIMCVGGIVMAVREDLVLSRLLLVVIPVMAGSIGFLISRMIPQFRAMQPRIDNVNRVMREQINGVRVVRAFVRESMEAQRFDDANVQLTESALRVGKLQALMFPTVMFMFNVSQVAVMYFGASRIVSGDMQPGSLTAFLAYLMQILFAVMMVTFISIMIPRAAVSAERITEVLDTVSSVVPPKDPEKPAPRGLVELADAEYRYPGAELPVLSGLNLVVKPGETTAIIGGTGAGKTTLLELIPRLIDATSGKVLLDGVDVKRHDLETMWSHIGMVPQRPFMFSGTVASNLRYGKPDATDDELWAALEVAQAKDFVEAMPLKLEAPIAQGGTNVSGGQRQRLSIARALLRKPKVYLFDDSFSALDLSTESRLRTALRPHTREATVIMVAQRVASIVEAEQIVVLDAGKIVGVGTHAQLLANNPTYLEIVQSQQGATEVAA